MDSVITKPPDPGGTILPIPTQNIQKILHTKLTQSTIEGNSDSDPLLGLDTVNTEAALIADGNLTKPNPCLGAAGQSPPLLPTSAGPFTAHAPVRQVRTHADGRRFPKRKVGIAMTGVGAFQTPPKGDLGLRPEEPPERVPREASTLITFGSNLTLRPFALSPELSRRYSGVLSKLLSNPPTIPLLLPAWTT